MLKIEIRTNPEWHYIERNKTISECFDVVLRGIRMGDNSGVFFDDAGKNTIGNWFLNENVINKGE